RDQPGSCPICGMALEPTGPSLDVPENPELIDMGKRLWVCAVLSVPLVLLTMGIHLFGWHLLPPVAESWVEFALATPVVLWGGWPFFERGWVSIVTRR